MGSFGERLRREREMRGITIEEIAAATKIGSRSLKALEDEDFKKLPGGIFNKGFVRAYAKFLGISEEQAVADYLAASGEPEEPAEINAAQLLAQREEVEAQSKAASKRARELQSIQTDGPSGFPWMALLGLVIIIALAWGGRVGYYKYKEHKQTKIEAAQREAEARAQAEALRLEQERQQAALAAQQAAAAAPTTPTDPQNPATPATGTNTPADSPATKPETKPSQPEKPPVTDNKKPVENATPAVAPGNFVVSVRAREASWIKVTADGKTLMSGTLAPSSKRDFQAHDKISLIIGNPPGTELAFNGKNMALPPLPADKKTQNVVISADGKLQTIQ